MTIALRWMVGIYVCIHVSAICWWLIPANGYPHDHRSQELPSWITRTEQAIFQWKKSTFGSWPAILVEQYVFTTANWQKWWLFAPNPMQVHDWITVKAVADWKEPDLAGRAPGSVKSEVWGDSRQPVYEEKPLYASYEGELDKRMRGFATHYLHDPKLVENLSSGSWDKPLASFAEYWGRVYRMKNGKKPLGIHVILNRGHIPRPFAARAPAAAEQKDQRVLWYLHF